MNGGILGMVSNHSPHHHHDRHPIKHYSGDWTGYRRRRRYPLSFQRIQSVLQGYPKQRSIPKDRSPRSSNMIKMTNKQCCPQRQKKKQSEEALYLI